MARHTGGRRFQPAGLGGGWGGGDGGSSLDLSCAEACVKVVAVCRRYDGMLVVLPMPFEFELWMAMIWVGTRWTIECVARGKTTGWKR
jgi:hypothetical protein